MQNRYAGDIGDYFKLAILRVIAPGNALGVAWWLFPDETHNGDGRHTAYLDALAVWRYIDPPLFDALASMVRSGERSVQALQAHALLDGATYYSQPISSPEIGSRARRAERDLWMEGLTRWASDRDVLFLDPDNGLEPATYSAGSAKAGKSVTVDEIMRLTFGNRPLLVYHHQTRRAGGHVLELQHWAARLRYSGCQTVDAVRVSAFSARAFFLINGTPELRKRLSDAVARWQSAKICWHPDC